MFRLLRKKPDHPGIAHQWISRISNLSGKISQFLQARWVNVMQRIEKRLTIRQKKHVLFLFILLMGGLSGTWLIQGFHRLPVQSPVFKPLQTITTTNPATLPDSLDLKKYRAYQAWRKAKDSLQQSTIKTK